MFETIKISQYSESVLRAGVKYSLAVALLATLFAPTAPSVWGALFEVDKIEKALSAPAYIPQESQDLANRFVDHILPQLLVNDERLAHQMGFGDSMNTATIDQAFAVMLIRRDDVMSLIERKAKPFDLVNNTNNWLEEGGRLVPKRIVFLKKAHDSANEAGTPARPSQWSSLLTDPPGILSRSALPNYRRQ